MIHCSILIVDDDEVDRKTIRRILNNLGWKGRIAEATHADDARTQACETAFDCILLDYRLPGTDGIDLLTELKADPSVQSALVMLTGEGNEMVAVEAMKRGASDYLPKSLLAGDTLFRIICQVVERARLQRELAEARAQLERQALYDSLTGLGSRNLFMRDLVRSMATSQRTRAPFCVLMMDLDKFKAANDQYGHDAGDAVLAEVGNRLAGIGRANDAFYRLGGDEFTALIDGVNEDTVLFVTQRISAAIAAPFVYKDNVIFIGISIGIAVYPGPDATADALLKTADETMYRAKRAGKAQSLAMPEMSEASK